MLYKDKKIKTIADKFFRGERGYFCVRTFKEWQRNIIVKSVAKILAKKARVKLKYDEMTFYVDCARMRAQTMV
jgi:hypothetical protein